MAHNASDAPQGYVAYSAVLYILVAVTWLSLAACGYMGWRFHKNGIVHNKWWGPRGDLEGPTGAPHFGSQHSCAPRTLQHSTDTYKLAQLCTNVSAAVCVAVAAAAAASTHRPLKLLRLVVAVFYKVFYVTVLNYLLGPLCCSWLVPGSTHRNVDFLAHGVLAR